MKALEKLMDMAEREFDSMSKTGQFRSKDDIEMAYKLVDIVKDITTINAMEDGGYSEEYRGNSYRNSYRDGYAREGNSYRQRRDSMGRYASEGREDMIHSLRRMASEASGEERDALEKCLDKMERMG